MKHYFFCAFLSLLLASCGGGGGGGDSTSSSKKAKAAKACTPLIANGTGELPWDTKTKKHSTICKVVSCNAGYDHVANQAQCGKTPAGFYSLAKDKTRRECPTTIPDHSLNNTASGSALETDCWNCKAGSLKNTSNKTCMLPGKGKYYDAQGNLQSCNDVGETSSGGFFRWESNTAPVASNDKCEFSCNSEFTKSESLFSCNKSRPCSVNPIANGDGLNLWNSNTNEFSTTCTVETCDAGYDNDVDTAQCQQTASGFYSPANDKARTACPTPTHSSAIASTGLSSADGCYDCDAGYWKNPQGSGSCDVPDLGKWVNATDNSKKDCLAINNANFNTWLAGTADAANKCPFSCSNNLIADTQGRSCVATTRSCSSVPNGSGTQNWETQNNRYGTCTVETCNTGFVKNTEANTCPIPSLGKYADNGVEKDCSLITGVAGGFKEFLANMGAVSSAAGCGFSCNAGFFKDSGNRTCNFPRKGKYVNTAGSEQGCNNVGSTPTGGFKKFLDNTGAVPTATDCNFSCNTSYVKSVTTYSCAKAQTCTLTRGHGTGQNRWNPITNVHSTTCEVVDCNAGYDSTADTAQCQQTASGFYSSANNKGRTPCPTPSRSSPTNRAGLSSPHECWSCTGGFVKNTQAETCDIPSTGHYANAAGVEKPCSDVEGDGVFSTFLANTGAVIAADGCGFSCNTGFVKSTSAFTCSIPTKGQYADNGVEKSCSPITGDGGGFDDFVANTGAVTAADGCGFSCNAGFVKDSSDRECNYPSTGSFVNAQGNEASCNPITLEGTAIATWQEGAASTDTACPFSCSSGYVKNSLGRECKYPSTGSFVNAQGNEASCNSITLEGTAIATWQEGAASTDTACPFSCTAGYVADSSGRECKYPSTGSFVNAQGTESPCTDITSITGFGSWESGAATDQDSCPFSCSASYAVSGRTCNKLIPEMLALGEDTSRILFDNGEVEAWGKVSNLPWRTHIKEDLGSHTPQALVSGYNHQCIILENAGQNHGRLMCWGANDEEQLGVGDTNPRSTPTPVTAAFLGDDGGGTPKMVKSVAAGVEHTCALLNDDTVVCWGNNGNGQIGGGSGSVNTIIGSAGDPLSGTATHIAAGDAHTCALLLSDKSVKCWGYNDFGQTGGGTPSLGANKTATELAVGAWSSCAILNDGSVKCWGRTPTSLGSNTATQITAGYMHACALLNDKSVKCWGLVNAEGQRGGGTSSPSQVLRGTLDDPLDGQTAIQIAAGYKRTCAIMESDHSVKCWGLNVDANDTGFYGQIVGEVLMKGGSDGTGTSTGETATLTTAPTPTATALESDANGDICALMLSGGTLGGNTWVAKSYIPPLPYNTGDSTTITEITDAIDNLITAIGSPVNIAGTNVTLSKTGTDKIAATTDTAVFEGMTLTILHDNGGTFCADDPVETNIPLSGASGSAIATGLWVISEDYTGSGDTTVNLDSVHIDLGTSNLTKEEIADKVVADVADASWVGKQNKDLPYTATKVESSLNPDCPVGDYCVLFERLFKGTEGNYGIPFGDSDYSH